jgi:hypothetical protein
MITVVVIVLAWPVESWLECREKQILGNKMPDAIYLVAGAKDQDRRIDALINFYSNLINTASMTNSNLTVLIGDDRPMDCWSVEDQKNLTTAEWGVKKVKKRFISSLSQVEIVPGKFSGTDGEMEELGKYLGSHCNIKQLVIVTSPFHVRRALGRLSVHLPREINVSVVTARAKWSDYAPWTVLSELLKIGRDSLGLSRTPLLSRKCRD